jgi:undecaprenyl-diphosphatase
VWLTEFVGTWPILDDAMGLLVSDLFIPVSISMIFVGYWVGARNSDERARTQWAVMGAATAMGIACLVIWILNHHLNVDPWPRPFETHEAASRAAELLFYGPTDPSMPSNPAAVGFAAFTGIWLRNRKASIPLLIIACLWCFARMYAGLHYPVDIVAGAVLGVATGYFCYKLLIWLAPAPVFAFRLARFLYLS